jgi:serine/threonine protein kinase
MVSLFIFIIYNDDHHDYTFFLWLFFILIFIFVNGGLHKYDLSCRIPEKALDVFFIFIFSQALQTSSPPMLHRDIKPDNILMTADGRAMIADFGISMPLSGESYKEQGRIGTPLYMVRIFPDLRPQ